MSVKFRVDTAQQMSRVAVITCDCCRLEFRTVDQFGNGQYTVPSWLRVLSPSTVPHEDLDFCDRCSTKVFEAIKAVRK